MTPHISLVRMLEADPLTKSPCSRISKSLMKKKVFIFQTLFYGIQLIGRENLQNSNMTYSRHWELSEDTCGEKHVAGIS